MDSPAQLAAAVLDRLEDDLPPVHWWLEQLAAADLAPEVAAHVAALRAEITNVEREALALVVACGKPAA
jgi:hypothetical protein